MNAKAIYKIYNAQAEQYEIIDPAQAQPGQTIVKMFWSKHMAQYVTVPGASLYTVSADGQMELINE